MPQNGLFWFADCNDGRFVFEGELFVCRERDEKDGNGKGKRNGGLTSSVMGIGMLLTMPTFNHKS